MIASRDAPRYSRAYHKATAIREYPDSVRLRGRLLAAGVRADAVPVAAALAALADTLRVAALHVTEKELTARLAAVAPGWAELIACASGEEAVTGQASAAAGAWEWHQCDIFGLAALALADKAPDRWEADRQRQAILERR